MPAMMRIQCPKCRQLMQVPDQSAGQLIRCPGCGQTLTLRVPAAASAPAPPGPAAPPAPPPARAVRPAAPPPVPPAVAAPRPAQVTRPRPAADDETPGEPEEFPELGRVVKQYLPRRYWIGLAAFGGFFLVMLPLALWALATGSKGFIAPVMILTAVGLCGTLVCGILALACLKRRVELRAHGFVSYSLFGPVACRWEDVAGMYVVRAGVFPATELRFDLESGKRFSVVSLVRGQDELGDRVAEATMPRLQARAEQALERGEAVGFGPYLSVGPKGLRLRPNGPKGDERRLRWMDIESVLLGTFQTRPGAGGMAGAAVQTELRILSEGNPPWVLASGNVANFAILLDLLEHRFNLKIKRP